LKLLKSIRSLEQNLMFSSTVQSEYFSPIIKHSPANNIPPGGGGAGSSGSSDSSGF
jgi:hypothetical protein